MKNWLGAFVLAGILAANAFAAKGPEVQIIDNKLSIDAEAVPLSRLLRLLDLATGMQSKVPPELANRNVSVKFSGLDLNEGMRKVFQGLPLDYVMIPGQSIVVTAASQAISASDSGAVYTPPPQVEQPFMQDFNNQVMPQPGNQQPATIATPFGPIANPRAGQPVPPNAPLTVPGQQNPLFPGQQQQPQQQQQQQPGMIQTPFGQIPGAPVPGTPAANPPFGAPSPFGTPMPGAPPANNNPLNLNSSPIYTNPAPVGAPGQQRQQ